MGRDGSDLWCLRGGVDMGRREGGDREGRQHGKRGRGRDGMALTCVGPVCVASSGNEIGDEGAKSIGDGLRTNSTLQTLVLSGAYGGRGGGRGVGRTRSGRDGETKGVGIARGEGCLRAGC